MFARGRVLLFTAFSIFTLFTPAPSAGQEVPSLTGPVTDLAHVIDASSAAELDKRIRSLQSASGDSIVVLTVPTYAPFGSIETFAVKVFEKAGIGERGKDNGALVVLAVTERRVKIEVGYGLEEFITDGFAGDTIRQTMLPGFRQGRYSEGLLAGTSRLIQRVAEGRKITLADVPRQASERNLPSLQAIILGIILFIVIINMIRRRGPPSSFGRRRWPRQTWSGWSSGMGGFGGGGFGGGFGGGGGGGFGGFGGGRSGGGGASGGW